MPGTLPPVGRKRQHGKTRVRCRHCRTIGTVRTLTISEQQERKVFSRALPALGTCRDKTRCNARLRARKGTADRHRNHVNVQRARKAARAEA